MRAVFLDKDGTLIEDVPYSVDPEQMRLLPGVAEGLRLLHAAGYLLVVVSNQSGVARGYFAEEALGPVQQRLRGLLADSGVPLAGFYFCPHHPGGAVAAYAVPCDCRKPEPGLLLRAAAEHGIDLAQSWLVGDNPSDAAAGAAAGCRTVLLQDPAGLGSSSGPDLHAADFLQATRLILAQDGRRSPSMSPRSPGNPLAGTEP